MLKAPTLIPRTYIPRYCNVIVRPMMTILVLNEKAKLCVIGGIKYVQKISWVKIFTVLQLLGIYHCRPFFILELF